MELERQPFVPLRLHLASGQTIVDEIIAAVDGICAGAGAILAMASDLRLATPEAKTALSSVLRAPMV